MKQLKSRLNYRIFVQIILVAILLNLGLYWKQYFGNDDIAWHQQIKAAVETSEKVVVDQTINNHQKADTEYKVKAKRKTIVTSMSSSHFDIAAELLYPSLRLFEPEMPFEVWDLGLSAEQVKIVHGWKHTTLKKFEFHNYPSYFDLNGGKAGEYAWKPVLIRNATLTHGGIILYNDAGNQFHGPLQSVFDEIEKVGVYSSWTTEKVRDWTHKGMLDYFKIPQNDPILRKRNCNGASVGFDSTNDKAMELQKEWYECAMHKECIAPEGSNRANHRQDQAALTVLMRKNGYSCDFNNGRLYDANTQGMLITIQHDNNKK